MTVEARELYSSSMGPIVSGSRNPVQSECSSSASRTQPLEANWRVWSPAAAAADRPACDRAQAAFGARCRADRCHCVVGRRNPMLESQSVSRLELARQEVDSIFGVGYAASHPELVAAVLNAGMVDWATRVLGAGLVDIANAVVEGSVQLPGSAGFPARSIVRP